MILISSCLVGEKVRYDGEHKLNTQFYELVKQGKAIHACPELLGGLPIPRPPAEIIGGDGTDVLDGDAVILTNTGDDVTEMYLKGAEKLLGIIKENHIRYVILKENSPSCGLSRIYDGTFAGHSLDGIGVTSALLKRNGIQVMNETEGLEWIETNGYLS